MQQFEEEQIKDIYQAQRVLKTLYWAILAFSVIVFCLIHFLVVNDYDTNLPENEISFLFKTIMVCATIGYIPLALKMITYTPFKKAISKNPVKGYYQWASMRLAVYSSLIALNAVGYVVFCSVSYVYMALMLAISMIFVYPSLNRCLVESGAGFEEE